MLPINSPELKKLLARAKYSGHEPINVGTITRVQEVTIHSALIAAKEAAIANDEIWDNKMKNLGLYYCSKVITT